MVKICSKNAAKKVLSNCHPDQSFWVADERKLNNLSELASALRSMENHVFSYHSNKEKTDFSNWVREVIGDAALARSLEKNKSREHALQKVKTRLAFLNSLKKGNKATPQKLVTSKTLKKKRKG